VDVAMGLLMSVEERGELDMLGLVVDRRKHGNGFDPHKSVVLNASKPLPLAPDVAPDGGKSTADGRSAIPSLPPRVLTIELMFRATIGSIQTTPPEPPPPGPVRQGTQPAVE